MLLTKNILDKFSNLSKCTKVASSADKVKKGFFILVSPLIFENL